MVETRSSSHALPPGPAPNTSTRRSGAKRTASSTTAANNNNNNNNSSSSSSKSKPLPAPPETTSSPSPATLATRSTTSSSSSTTPQPWSHAPTTLTLAWLAISLPLVIWDTGYVLGRPATMPGGWAHFPVWAPYELYGRVDHMYGFKQWNLGNGFTAAQGFLNAIETALYLAYWWTWYRSSGRRADGLGIAAAAAAAATTTSAKQSSSSSSRRRIAGRAAALAVVLGFAASVMTVSKTVLYWLNEYYSGFDNIGHNKPWDLILLWIIPNGAWLIVPSYMIYQLGAEIIDAIVIASQATGSIKEA